MSGGRQGQQEDRATYSDGRRLDKDVRSASLKKALRNRPGKQDGQAKGARNAPDARNCRVLSGQDRDADCGGTRDGCGEAAGRPVIRSDQIRSNIRF